MVCVNIRRRTKLIALLAGGLMLSACGGSGDPMSTEPTTQALVSIDVFMYEPETLRVGVGTRIRWTNGDDIAHTVTSGTPPVEDVPGVTPGTDAMPDGRFDGQLDGPGSTFEWVADDSGTFTYYCEIHAGMTGEIVVEI